MVTKQIDLEATPLNLDDLLDLLQLDTEIVLKRGDILLARLSPIETHDKPDRPRIPGLHAGTTWVSDDFDDPLPDEFWSGEA